VKVNFSSLTSTGFSLPSGQHLTANDFRMISVPAALADRNPVSVLGRSLNTSAPSTYDTTSWRLFRWNGARYIEHPNAGDFDPGAAFWLIALTPATIDAGGGASTTDVSQSLRLDPEWNQVGNPYPFPVALSAILDSNQTQTGLIEPTLWRWTGSGYETVTVMKPWEGYWMKSLASSPIFLTVPRMDADLVTPRVAAPVAKAIADSVDWKLQIVASAGSLQDAENYAAVSRQAAPQWDPLDLSKPPLVGAGGLALSFPHEDWSRHPGWYAVDVRPPDPAGASWAFVVETDLPNTPVYLEVRGAARLAPELSVMLIDTDRHVERNIRSDAVYTFTSGAHGTVRHFLLAVGPPGYLDAVRRSLLPDKASLGQNAPNPFNPATTITFALPQAAHVILSVYNALGQEVRRLVDEIRPAGYQTVEWDGRNDQGRPVASGVYLYRLRAGSFTQTRKMVLLR
jgi:hypothetical protein